MAELFATQSDLEDSLGRALTSAEEPKANAALRYASNLVRAQYPPARSLITVPDGVTDAVVSLAERRFTRSNIRQVGQVQFDNAAQAGTFNSDERVLLDAALGSSGNMTVSLAGPNA